jgi:hypothetical protein
MLGNIYEVLVQLGMYHRFVVSTLYAICMLFGFKFMCKMITKAGPLNRMRQALGTVACCVINLEDW